WLFLYLGNDRKPRLRAILRHQEPDRIGSDIDGGQAFTRFGYWYRCHAIGVGVAPEVRASPRSSAWCLIDLPSTRKTTSSATLVARSATRSRLRLTRNNSIPAPIMCGSSIIWVSRIRKTERWRLSTLSSRRQTTRADT